MSVLGCLVVILGISMYAVGKRHGLTAFISLFLNFFFMFVVIVGMRKGYSPLVLTGIACCLMIGLNLFFINGFYLKTKVAAFGSLITLLLLFIVIWWLVPLLRIQGLGEEEVVEMDMYSFYVGISFLKITICTLAMGTVGAITDTAMSVASALEELMKKKPDISTKQIWTSGIKMGRDILGTTTNTLLFAFIGNNLALVIWLADLGYTVERMLNSKVMVAELFSMCCSLVGVILVIPVVSFQMSLVKKQQLVE